MPDTLALTVSTGVSFGLLAGIVSGVCYLMANGLGWPHSRGSGAGRRRLRSAGEASSVRGGGCAECGREGRDDGGEGEGDEEQVCDCREQYRSIKFEEGHWFLKQVQKTLSYIPWSLSTDKLDAIGLPRGGRDVGGGGRGSVRQFMEQLSERLAGGELDRTSVASLYDHPLYEAMFLRHHATLRDALAALALALRSALTNLPSPARRDGAVGAVGAAAAAGAEQPSASGAHARLKRLVRRVVEEAMALPALSHYSQRPHDESDAAAAVLHSHTYEDLLATAILNKVIERYQTESASGRSGGASSGIHSASASPTPSAPSSSSVSPPHSAHTPPPLDEDDGSDSEWERDELAPPELPRRVPFPEFGGDIVHLSELTGDEQERELDEVSGSDLQAADGSWEENWLFQRKKVKTMQSVPVPMLVPSAGSEYRALIGDRDADDTTDLSDAASDTDEDPQSDLRRAVHSKTLIGGRTPTGQLLDIAATGKTDDPVQREPQENDKSVYDFDDSHENEIDNAMEVQEVTADFNSSNSESVIVVAVDSGPLSKAEFAVGEIHRTGSGNAISTDEIDGVVSTINTAALRENCNSLSSHQREGEYEETYATPEQRYATVAAAAAAGDDATVTPPHGTVDESSENEHNNNNYDDELIPGSIADRERKKWLNYVEMPNNPYSAEAIQKRLSNKSTSAIFDFLTTKASSEDKVKENKASEKPSEDEGNKPASPSPKILRDVLAKEVPQYKRYGRDYYINEAKRSAGGRKKSNLSKTTSMPSMHKSTSLDQFDVNEFTSPAFLIQRFNSLDVTEQQGTPKTYTSLTNNSITINNINNNKKDIVSIEYEDISEQSLFSAKPMYVQDDIDETFEDIMRCATQEPSNIQSVSTNISDNIHTLDITKGHGQEESFLSSSSLEDSIKIYNVPTGEIVRNPKDTEHLKDCDTLPVADNNDNVVTPDKQFAKLTETDDSGKHDTVAVAASSDKMIKNESTSSKTIEDLQITLPKVKDLAKKFVKSVNYEDAQYEKTTPRRRKFSNEYELEVVNKYDQKLIGKNSMYMHSLTARSISKEFREELKLSMATPIKIPGGANELPEGVDEITTQDNIPGSPVPEPGTLKNKLAFFESLKF